MYDKDTFPMSTIRVAASGQVSARPGKLLGFYALQTAVAGTIIFSDGATEIARFSTMASAEGINIPFPAFLEFRTSLEVVLTDVGSITAYLDV